MSGSAMGGRRVLVVGGGGFIGRHVIEKLIFYRHSVVGLDLSRPEVTAVGVDWIVGSAADEALFASAVLGCDVVLFLASSSLPGSANADMAAEVVSHVRLVVKSAEISCAQGVQMFVFASSGGTVYGPSDEALISETARTIPLSAYGASKVAIENYLSVLSHLRGMKTISLRVANPFGPGQRAHRNQGFVAAAISSASTGHKLTIWGDGSVIRDFIFVEDVGDAFARCCAYSGKSCTINIGSGRGVSLMEVVRTVEHLAGCRINVEFKESRKIDVQSNILDVSLASRVLDWRPLTEFDEGVEITIKTIGS